MITADFFSSKDGRLLGFSLSGHADYSEFGNDIACASVSSAAMMAANTITEAFKLDAKVSVEENRIMLKLSDDKQGTGDKILLGFLTHLYCLSEEFNGCIKVSVIQKNID